MWLSSAFRGQLPELAPVYLHMFASVHRTYIQEGIEFSIKHNKHNKHCQIPIRFPSISMSMLVWSTDLGFEAKVLSDTEAAQAARSGQCAEFWREVLDISCR